MGAGKARTSEEVLRGDLDSVSDKTKMSLEVIQNPLVNSHRVLNTFCLTTRVYWQSYEICLLVSKVAKAT
jgi:hypothetical protein